MNADPWLRRWHLVPDGAPLTTPTSLLLPVRRHGEAAMLKIARQEEERRGGALMAWWQGQGAARVLAHEDPALLLERLDGPRSLATLAAAGQDDEATRTLCAVIARLHAHRRQPLPDLFPLARWFEPLWSAAETHGGFFAQAASRAKRLLDDPRDGGPHGWLAIDPKGLLGERTFDYVNILRNPDPATALAPGRFECQVDRLAEAAALDRRRLLAWTVAFTGLSAAWHGNDGGPADLDLAIGKRALAAFASGA